MAKTIDLAYLKTSAKQQGNEWFLSVDASENPEIGDIVIVSPGRFGFTGEIVRMGDVNSGIRAGRDYSDIRVYLKKIAAN